MYNFLSHSGSFPTGEGRGRGKTEKGPVAFATDPLEYLFILDEYIYGLSNSRLIQISSYATTNMYERFVSCCKSTHFF